MDEQRRPRTRSWASLVRASTQSHADDVAVVALDDDVDLALLLVAVVEELDGAVGPVGLAEQLHGDEALQHGSRDGTVFDDPALVGADEVGEPPLSTM